MRRSAISRPQRHRRHLDYTRLSRTGVVFFPSLFCSLKLRIGEARITMKTKTIAEERPNCRHR